jgi:hypothetical protein
MLENPTWDDTNYDGFKVDLLNVVGDVTFSSVYSPGHIDYSFIQSTSEMVEAINFTTASFGNLTFTKPPPATNKTNPTANTTNSSTVAPPTTNNSTPTNLTASEVEPLPELTMDEIDFLTFDIYPPGPDPFTFEDFTIPTLEF